MRPLIAAVCRGIFAPALLALVAVPAQACDRLIFALHNNSVVDAVAAVRAGCDVNGRLDASGATALMWANNVAMGKALLGEGARVDARDENGRSAAVHAAASGDVELLRLLISRGASVDSPAISNCGALCEAILQPKNRVELVRELVRAGAAVDGTDCWGRTPLYAAGAAGTADVVRLVAGLGGKPNRYETYGGNTLLMQAIQSSNNLATVDALLNAGASAAWPNSKSCQTALHIAVSRGSLPIARRLIDSGAPLSDTDAKGKTALDLARDAANFDLVQLLTRAGATSGGTPRTDCVNSTDTPEAYDAWQTARRRTRVEACTAVVQPTINAPARGR